MEYPPVVFFPKRQKKIGPLILPDENIDSPYEPIDHHVGGHVFGSENFQKCQPESGFRPLREFQNSTFSYKSQQSFQIVLASQSGPVCMTLKEQHKVFDFHYENDEMMTLQNRIWV